MTFSYKWLKVPAGEKTLQAVELYEVRWTSRRGPYHADTRPEAEVFTSKQDAESFKIALENAFKLLRHRGEGTAVEMEKRE